MLYQRVFFLLGVFLLFYTLNLFGISSLDFSSIAIRLTLLKSYNLIGIKLGICFILLSFFFKFAIFPVHAWAPDVYEGTWDIVMSILATAFKVVYFSIFLRLFFFVFNSWYDQYHYLLLLGAIGSLFYSTISSIGEYKLKRMLAYTSIGQMGFVLLSLSTNSAAGIAAAIFHFWIYILSLVLFFLVYFYSIYTKNYKLLYISDFSSFGRRSPLTSIVFTVSLLSMAGLPPFSGFFSKFYIFMTLIQNGNYLLTLYGLILSIITGFVYIRIIKIMWFENNFILPEKYSLISLENVQQNIFIFFIINIYVFIIIGFMFIPELYIKNVIIITQFLIQPF